MNTPLVGTILGKKAAKLLYKPSSRLVLPETNLGVEVEVEGVPIRAVNQFLINDMKIYWDAKEDPSLHDRGVEFTFTRPMFGEDAVLAVNLLLEKLKEVHGIISKRAGIHVHVDSRDLTPAQLIGFVANYIVFEPALYAWCGGDRDSNNFCLPWYKSESSLDEAILIFKEMQQYDESENARLQVLALCERFHRYAGLNLKSLFEFGSLEFRQLPTTFDVERLLKWINIILMLKKEAMDAPTSNIAIVNKIHYRGVNNSLGDIFGQEIHREMSAGFSFGNLSRFISHVTVPNAREFLIALDPQTENNQEFTWNANVSHTTRENHPGFLLWRAKNFPKGEKLTPESPKKPKRKDQLGGLNTIEVNRPLRYTEHFNYEYDATVGAQAPEVQAPQAPRATLLDEAFTEAQMRAVADAFRVNYDINNLPEPPEPVLRDRIVPAYNLEAPMPTGENPQPINNGFEGYFHIAANGDRINAVPPAPPLPPNPEPMIAGRVRIIPHVDLEDEHEYEHEPEEEDYFYEPINP